MKVRRIFTTEMDLEIKVSRRFRRRLLKLYERYMKRARSAKNGVDMLKAACVAWAFVCAVEDGGAALARDFESMMHGECANFIEMDDRLLVFGDDDYAQEAFIWDATHLLLEEHGEDELERLQPVYDVVDLHVRDAYEVENEDEVLVEYVEEDEEPCAEPGTECVEEKKDVCRGETAEETVVKIGWSVDDMLRMHADGIAESLMVKKEAVVQKLAAMKALGMIEIVRWFVQYENMYKNELAKNKMKQMENQGLNCKTYVAAGAMNIENIEHVENLFPGSRDMIASFLGGKKKVESMDDKEEVSDLEKALKATASMAKEGFFKPQKLYIGAFQIIKERIAPDMDTASFCRMIAKKTDLSEDLLPKNENIRKIYFKSNSQYPNWKIEGENIESTQDIIDIAKELLRRMS